MATEISFSCHCGRSFTLPGALTHHKKSCSASRKRLSGAVSMAKEVWSARKKARHSLHDDARANPGLPSDLQPDPVQTRAFPVCCSFGRPQRLNRRPPHRVREPYYEGTTARPLPNISRPPLRVPDNIPEGPTALPPPNMSIFPTDAHTLSTAPRQVPINRECTGLLSTTRNIFGLFRRYHGAAFPIHDPDSDAPLQDFSLASFRELLKIIGAPDFHSADVRNTKWDQINSVLGKEEAGEWENDDAGWIKDEVTISVPFYPRQGVKVTPNDGPQNLTVHNFYHRDLLSIIREKLSRKDDDANFRYEPYELLWQRNGTSQPVRVYGEMYSSQAFLDAHRALQASPPEPGCKRSRVIAGLMLWSDATHLTSFGDTKLSPLYLYFANDSKYQRCRPTAHLCEHVAYFQTLPANFNDVASQQTPKGFAPNPKVRTHCSRELLHAQLKVLFNDEFIEAWKHGIVILCCDGIERRFYPRIFTYSADYPEKVNLASIRQMGRCPCPRCLVQLSDAHLVGTLKDMRTRRVNVRTDDIPRRYKVKLARRLIYEKNYQVDSAGVEHLLGEQASVPVSNAFSERLGPLGFDMFPMFVVDLMHDWELGVGKSLFIHLIRILGAQDESLVIELDKRFRQVPSFGTSIRRFSANCSEMKQMAARDIENILQCAIPVFEGLLPEPHNGTIRRLLFIASHWHGLAKLRMHIDPTLDILSAVEQSLGEELRYFKDVTCSAFRTLELAREAEKRTRRANKKKAKVSGIPGSAASEVPDSQPMPALGKALENERKSKTFNMNTYKCHALADYSSTIRMFGTTDSYTTEPAELEHHRSKVRYSRTSRKGFLKQLTEIERREARLRHIAAVNAQTANQRHEEVTPDFRTHYNVGTTQNYPVNIPFLIQRNPGDPALKNFVPKLKAHLLPRIKAMMLQEANARTPSESELGLRPLINLTGISSTDASARDHVYLKGDTMYDHRLMRINYTSYDVRRCQDLIHCGTDNRDIMVLAQNDTDSIGPVHHFWFARVLGIYHANVIYTGPGTLDYSARRTYFLFVRWFQLTGDPLDWEECELDRIRFPPVASEDAFGFLNPDEILRSCHIIPAFWEGRARPDGSTISKFADDSTDWRSYYVNRHVSSHTTFD
ncbi:hypothetical protein BV25DRAFT_1816540 [Artomyces pyxidatus]|uniref:Uncharacterized protein n=1 Tax=Artomyces pyxidatus TaxID=48021 RepID=A0ACB8SEL5_9AGAM|nr:hypothetical protein BV25DRAFT_1816540 [Artomyces pyxidatus]